MTKRPRSLTMVLAVAIAIATAVPAGASVSTAVSVSGSVIADCTTITPSNTTLLIGTTYDPFTYPAGTPLKNPNALTLSTNCSLGDTIGWSVGIGGGCNHGSVSGDRSMADTSSTHYLSYELYTTTAFSPAAEWSTNNCGKPAAASQPSGGLANANGISLYAAIPGGQNVPAAVYSDIIQITVNY